MSYLKGGNSGLYLILTNKSRLVVVTVNPAYLAAARQTGIARWQGAVKVNFTIKSGNGSFQVSLKEFRLIFTVARENFLVECVARPGGFLVLHGWGWIGDYAASNHLLASGSVGVDPEYSGIFFKQALSFTPV